MPELEINYLLFILLFKAVKAVTFWGHPRRLLCIFLEVPQIISDLYKLRKLLTEGAWCLLCFPAKIPLHSPPLWKVRQVGARRA